MILKEILINLEKQYFIPMKLDEQRIRMVSKMADLCKERDACYSQYRSAIDEAQRIRLQRKLDDFDKKIHDLNRQLDGKDLTVDTNRRALALEEKLPKIDFKEQINTVKNILEQFTDYGAALFFISDYLNMAGDLFCLEFRKILNDETTDLKHYEVAFSNDSRLDEIGFLQRVGNHLGIEQIENQDEYSKIIEKLLNIIENGSIVFIELKKIDLLDNKEYFLSWLVENFWKDLTNKLPLACRVKDINQVRFIILIVDHDIFEECSNQPFFCSNQCFSMGQIFAITLNEWTETDINTWLTKHSGLPRNIIATMASSVYGSSRGGVPKLICDALRNKLS
ncbi:MAG: hypothetical protein ACK5SC_00565 [Microcystis sp.]